MSGDTEAPVRRGVEDMVRGDPTRFSLFQLARLLERDLGEDLGEQLRVRPQLGLENPNAEVLEARDDPSGSIDLITSLAGLYGVNSPLPTFYTEDLINAEQEDNPAARALLDVFHRRLYLLLYQSLRKYRPLFPTVEGGDDRFRALLDSFIGLRDAAIRERVPDPNQLLRYVGLFAQQPRSATGLRVLLQDALPGVPVEIIQCEQREVKVPNGQQMRVGEQCGSLGEDTIVGGRILDRMGRLVVKLGPLGAERFHEITEGPEWKTLIFLIRQYLNTSVEVEIEWCLEEGEATPMQPGGGQWSRLGQDSWMGPPEDAVVSGRVRLQEAL